MARSSAKVCSIDSRHIVCVSVRRQPLPVKQTRDLYLFDCPSRQVLGSRSLPCEAGFHTGSKVCIYVLRTLGPLVCCRNGLEDFFARKRPIFLPHCRISGHGGRLDQSRLPASGVTDQSSSSACPIVPYINCNYEDISCIQVSTTRKVYSISSTAREPVWAFPL